MPATTPPYQCEYCGGPLQRKFTSIGFDHFGSMVPQEVERQVCVRCGIEESVLCPQCETRTRPCSHCLGQACICERYGQRVHWYGGFRIEVAVSRAG